ncbi:LANO_0G10704g1_1 [Lachancea nothofagi CBS 11611]|uniref:LANO_0G10704g1_1 n=1 Tax=Lachancea nothofagi CBS 11611 TaxID=1266666 RepID=A0A1G4KJ60_9SACH|nr:LANO_0G10704g1_1 [Lachancea nothofagi CBS 11611]
MSSEAHKKAVSKALAEMASCQNTPSVEFDNKEQKREEIHSSCIHKALVRTRRKTGGSQNMTSVFNSFVNDISKTPRKSTG